jgi:hypothetical protein
MQDNRVMVDHTSRAAQVTPNPVTTTSADGVALAGVHLSREAPAHGTALVVAHAFTHHTRRPTTRKLPAALAAEAPVVALDMHIAGDHYLSAAHARALAAASGGRARLWEEPGDGRERARSTVGTHTPAERRAARSEVG